MVFNVIMNILLIFAVIEELLFWENPQKLSYSQIVKIVKHRAQMDSPAVHINYLPEIVSCTSSKSLSQSELDYHRIDQSINGSDQSDEK